MRVRVCVRTVSVALFAGGACMHGAWSSACCTRPRAARIHLCIWTPTCLMQACDCRGQWAPRLARSRTPMLYRIALPSVSVFVASTLQGKVCTVSGRYTTFRANCAPCCRTHVPLPVHQVYI